MGPIARIEEELLVDALADRVVDIGTDGVDELERTHPESDPPQRIVNGFHGRHTLAQDPDRLEVERACDAVDDEAGRVCRHHRRLAQAACSQGGRVDHRRLGHRSGHHLDQSHKWYRVEEVHAQHPLGALRRRRDLCDGKRARVRRQDRLVGRRSVQLVEGVALQGEVLGNRLDHEVREGQLPKARRLTDPSQRERGFLVAHLPLLGLAS